MKIIFLLLIMAAMTNPISAISISFSGDGFSEQSDYSLPDASSLQSVSSGGQTHTSIQGAGYASQNGLGIATDDASSQIEIASSGGDVSISANGQDVAGRDIANEIEWGTDFLISDGTQTIAGPVYTATGGRTSAYAFTGYRQNVRDPKLKWVLKNDAYMTGAGLSASSVQSAIAAAANTWDNATNQNLFADSNLVTLDPNVAADKYNKINTVSWRSFGTSKCLAYATTFYSGSKKVEGYKTALDSDLVFNTDYQWRIDSGVGFDVQTAALHEMGHTLGLADLYGKTQFTYDTRQVMHYYTGVKRTLGNGDAAGIYALYR